MIQTEEFSLSEYGVNNVNEYDREDESDRDFDLLESSRNCLENGNDTSDDSHQNLGGSGDSGGSLDLKISSDSSMGDGSDEDTSFKPSQLRFVDMQRRCASRHRRLRPLGLPAQELQKASLRSVMH